MIPADRSENMTPHELKIYRLDARVMLLERVFSRMLFGLLVGRGATVEQARYELTLALERDKSQIQAELPSLAQGDPARNALLQEEFREIFEDLRALFNSYS
jgi:hypothetical protein